MSYKAIKTRSSSVSNIYYTAAEKYVEDVPICVTVSE